LRHGQEAGTAEAHIMWSIYKLAAKAAGWAL
jgi:hypothetical protein